MQIVYEKLPGDMDIVLSPGDIERLNSVGACCREEDFELAVIRTTVMRDPDVYQAVAEVLGPSITVFLPTRATLPLDVLVSEMTGPYGEAKRFLFGEAGKITLIGQVEIGKA